MSWNLQRVVRFGCQGQRISYLDRALSGSYTRKVLCQTLAAAFPEVKQPEPETDPSTVPSDKDESAWNSTLL